MNEDMKEGVKGFTELLIIYHQKLSEYFDVETARLLLMQFHQALLDGLVRAQQGAFDDADI